MTTVFYWIGGVLAVLIILAIIGARFGPSDAGAGGGSAGLPDAEVATDEDVLRLVQAGHKIQAIKLYRQIHGVGLADAKKFVDELSSRLGPGA